VETPGQGNLLDQSRRVADFVLKPPLDRLSGGKGLRLTGFADFALICGLGESSDQICQEANNVFSSVHIVPFQYSAGVYFLTRCKRSSVSDSPLRSW